jgi:hypothetical protein
LCFHRLSKDVDNLLCNGHAADNHPDETDSQSSNDDDDDGDDSDDDCDANNATPASPAPQNIQHFSVDPVREVAPDLQVKIADLGNACWVVSGQAESRAV